MAKHWDAYDRRWQQLGAPLRPPPDVVRAVERVLEPAGKTVLLLGVTPELSDLSRSMIAVDSSASMIAKIWPGNDGSRRAMLGDWLALPVEAGSMDCVVGDGCLSAVDSRDARLGLLREIARVLAPDGAASVRLFAAPEQRETLDTVRRDTQAGAVANFHVLKWRAAMACVSEDADCRIAVQSILDTIHGLFPDRDALASLTGWSRDTIGTIDLYAGSPAVYTFATADILAEEASRYFEDVSLVASGDYPLAERCPLLVMRRPKVS
ncbi:class I SAM-dependent methyltransferase [Mesorhizobium sp. 10J20-29]